MTRIRVLSPMEQAPGFKGHSFVDSELEWMLAEHASETMHDFEIRGEQPDSPALPADGGLRGDVPLSGTERREV